MLGHEFHDQVHKWFRAYPERSWATCPLTQAGFLRIASRRLGGLRSHVKMALKLLETNCLSPNHEYWPAEIDLRELGDAHRQRLIGPNQVADMQLLLLAHRHPAQLATFDKGIRELAAATRYVASVSLL